MMKEFEEMKKMLNEIKKEFKEFEKELDDENKEEEESESEISYGGCLTGNCMICATDQGIKIAGDKAQLCTLLSKIVETLNKQAHIDKEVLETAFNFSFMSTKDIKKTLLKKLKDMLEKADLEDDSEEESEEDDE